MDIMRKTLGKFKREALATDRREADEVLQEQVEQMREVLVGSSIVEVRHKDTFDQTGLEVLLSTGEVVEVMSIEDCCAYGEVTRALFDVAAARHAITSVEADGAYERWFILAEADTVLELEVDWSEGNGFYAYGLDIRVKRG